MIKQYGCTLWALGYWNSVDKPKQNVFQASAECGFVKRSKSDPSARTCPNVFALCAPFQKDQYCLKWFWTPPHCGSLRFLFVISSSRTHRSPQSVNAEKDTYNRRFYVTFPSPKTFKKKGILLLFHRPQELEMCRDNFGNAKHLTLILDLVLILAKGHGGKGNVHLHSELN